MRARGPLAGRPGKSHSTGPTEATRGPPPAIRSSPKDPRVTRATPASMREEKEPTQVTDTHACSPEHPEDLLAHPLSPVASPAAEGTGKGGADTPGPGSWGWSAKEPTSPPRLPGVSEAAVNVRLTIQHLSDLPTVCAFTVSLTSRVCNLRSSRRGSGG